MRQPTQTFVDSGDVALSVLEWAGSGDPVLLLHATGFHSYCWNEVVRRLGERRVIAIDLPFHGGSRCAGRPHWPQMAQAISRCISRLELDAIVGAGHSLGGHLLARCAAHEPGRFRHLLLIDPVILPPQRYALLGEQPGEIDPATHPVSRRKNDWHGPAQMFERFRDRSPFDTWEPAVLRDYCEHALLPAGQDGLRRLACDPMDEAGIYLNQRGNESIYAQLPRLTMPVTLLRAPSDEGAEPGGAHSPTWPQLAAALPNCQEVYLSGHNHFIPMQDPALVARYLLAAP